jgi:hypothetical protein
MANVLTYFDVDGYWYSGDAPDVRGTDGAPAFSAVTGYVDLIPRVPQGFSVRVDELDLTNDPAGSGTVVDTDVSFPPRTARIWDGRLSTINQTDTPTIQLLANTAVLNLAVLLPDTEGKLIYDVRFRDVRFNNAPQALANFAFEAPTDATPVSLTDDALVRLPYAGPKMKVRP